MLVLSRKVGESLVLDGGIVIRVVDIGSGRIRLGIEAPPQVHIRRSELEAEPRPVFVRATREGGDE